MVIALGGTLQRSHLHVANVLNVVVHTSASDKGAIDAAAAYSASPAKKNARIVIGDTLTLEINVAWYAGQSLVTGKPGKVSSRGFAQKHQNIRNQQNTWQKWSSFAEIQWLWLHCKRNWPGRVQYCTQEGLT
jgi:hypothetical protein